MSSDPIAYFLGKFREMWRDGLEARLSVECHAGQAWMSIHHRLPCPPSSSPQSPRKRPSPSRIRRRARHAHARAAAAQADPSPVQVDGKIAKADIAIQTEMSDTVAVDDSAVQADIQSEHDAHPALTEHLQHCQAASAEQAHHDDRQQKRRGQAEHRQAVVHITSERDDTNQEPTHYIPQLDGNISPNVSQCSNCEKVLWTIDDYKWHYETKHGREDCRLLKSMLN